MKGAKEDLHHFAIWGRTATHVIDAIGHELESERKGVMLRFSDAGILCGSSCNGKECGVAGATTAPTTRMTPTTTIINYLAMDLFFN